MSNGIRALSKVQIGVEAVAGGTTDPATAILELEGFLKDNLQVVFPKIPVGRLGGLTRSYIPKTGGEITLEGPATFEQSGYILNSSIYHTTPTSDSGSGFVYTWAVQTADSDPISTTDLDTLVIEGGDNAGEEVMRYCFLPEWTLSGAAGEALMWSTKAEGRAPAPGTFTAGLTPPLINEPILVSLGHFYVDPSTDPAGTTEKSATLLDVNLKYTSGWKSKLAADGRLDFSFIKRADDEVALEVTFEHNATAITEKAAWRAQTERVIRLKFPGNTLASAGTYTTKALIIDLYGVWETFDKLDEQDSNNVVKGTFHVGYSAAAGHKMDVTLVNELSVLP